MENDAISDFHFFACDGGPHLVLPSSARQVWTGNGSSYDPVDPTTDYARACSVERPAELIPVGSEQALVLAGSPPMSAWVGAPDGSVYLYVFETWTGIDLDALARAAARAIVPDHFTDTNLRWPLPNGGLVLMFAGDTPGNSAYGELPIPIRAGKYRILSGNYEDAGNKVLLIALERHAI